MSSQESSLVVLARQLKTSSSLCRIQSFPHHSSTMFRCRLEDTIVRVEEGFAEGREVDAEQEAEMQLLLNEIIGQLDGQDNKPPYDVNRLNVRLLARHLLQRFGGDNVHESVYEIRLVRDNSDSEQLLNLHDRMNHMWNHVLETMIEEGNLDPADLIFVFSTIFNVVTRVFYMRLYFGRMK